MIPFIIIALLIEMIFKPRLDYTRDKVLLLWYGRSNRTYTILKK